MVAVAEGARQGLRVNRRRAAFLMAAGVVAALALLAYLVAPPSSPNPRRPPAFLETWVAAIVLGGMAAVITRRWPRAGGLLAMAAAALGLPSLIPYGGMALWLLPGVLLGSGGVSALGVREEPGRRYLPVTLAIAGGVVSAMAAFLLGFSLAFDGGSPSQYAPVASIYLEAASILSFCAGAVMVWWLRVGSLLLIPAVVIGTVGLVAYPASDPDVRWGPWCVAAVLIVASLAVAVAYGWRSGSGGGSVPGGRGAESC